MSDHENREWLGLCPEKACECIVVLGGLKLSSMLLDVPIGLWLLYSTIALE